MSSFEPQIPFPDHDLWAVPHIQQDGLEHEIAQYLAEHKQLQPSNHTPASSIPAMTRNATLSPPLGPEAYSPVSTSSRLSASWSDHSSVRQVGSPKSTSRRSPSTTSTTPTSPATSRKTSTAESINGAPKSTSVTKDDPSTDALPRCYAHNCRGRVFSCLANYKRHVRERERRIRVTCEFCMKSFSRRSNRDTHVQGGRCKILRSLESNNPHMAHQPNHAVASPDLQPQRSMSPDAYQPQHQQPQYQQRQYEDFQQETHGYTHMQMPVQYQQTMQQSMYPYAYDMAPMLLDEFGQDRRGSFE